MAYTAQKHLKPKALSGISDEQIDQHWQLYEGYVKNTNEILDELGEAVAGSHHWSELKRRLGFEFNGMVLHEYYFGNLSAGGSLSPQSALGEALAERWADVDAWREDFAKTGAMRGIGWVVLYHEPATGSLFNWWISDHEINHPAGLNPILVMDVFEHAWMVDYGAGEKSKYIDAFLDNIAWEVVEQRFKDSLDGHVPARF
jgi:Fe-Mn family superoxide dismutase